MRPPAIAASGVTDGNRWPVTAPTLPTLTRRGKTLIGVGVAVLALLLVGPRLVGITTDWLWFSDLGYRSTYSTILWTRVVVFLVVTLVVAAIIFAAVYTAYRSRPIVVSSFGPSDPLSNYRAAVSLRPRSSRCCPPWRSALSPGSSPGPRGRRCRCSCTVKFGVKGPAVRHRHRFLRVRPGLLPHGSVHP